MSEIQDERALLLSARSFDLRALAAIYDEYSPMLYRYAYRLTGDSTLAEECVADTFTKFLHALRRGGGPERQLKAYLYRSAHNWVVDRYRAAAPATTALDPQTADDQRRSPSEVLQDKERRAGLRAALFELTTDQRQVLVLKYLEDLTNREVAAALNKTVGAVKALQHRALTNLRRRLEQAGQKQ